MDETQHVDSYPWTWEPAAAAALVMLIACVIALQLGRSAALLLTGAGAWWPPTDQLLTSSWSILGGNPAAGLDLEATTTPAALMWVLAAVIAAVLCTLFGWLIWRLKIPGSNRGMATADEAHQLLGITRLRRNRKIIRPDLSRRGIR